MCRYCSPKFGQHQKAVMEEKDCVIQIDKETPISKRLNNATFTVLVGGPRYNCYHAKIRFCPMCGKKLIR